MKFTEYMKEYKRKYHDGEAPGKTFPEEHEKLKKAKIVKAKRKKNSASNYRTAEPRNIKKPLEI